MTYWGIMEERKEIDFICYNQKESTRSNENTNFLIIKKKNLANQKCVKKEEEMKLCYLVAFFFFFFKFSFSP